jgi:phosphoribosylaminoimidazolecarboxamide formyltransferase/IMP cyclohydrolase
MQRALISVFYKEEIEVIAKKLQESGWEIISSGGTAGYLKEKGIRVTEIAAITGFPQILDGRVKTLHPLIFGPILAKKSPDHLDQLKQLGAGKIDLVIVNFYPFEQALQDREKGLDFMIEHIDIGGPSMVRAAAKNFQDTVVVVDRQDYLPVVESIIQDGDIPLERRRELSAKAFAYTSFYDSLITNYLGAERPDLPDYLSIAGRRSLQLRYGENPHQRAALYIHDQHSPLHQYEKFQGKELSFNNILDMSMAYEVVNHFPGDDHFCVVVKHQNPCGAALGDNQQEAFQKAFDGDAKSAFGGIVGFNTPLEGETAEAMKKIFFEVIVAPDYRPEALEVFKKKKNLRIIKMSPGYREPWDIKTVPGGFVFQDRDHQVRDGHEFELQTARPVQAQEFKDIAFGWKLIKFVKSNAIIIVKDRMLLGVGAGQMSRVDAVDIAVRKSQFPLEGSVLLSDAFFPFADSIEIAARHRIAVVVEPGGSVRDDEVIAEAQKHHISLLFTGMRHFRH